MKGRSVRAMIFAEVLQSRANLLKLMVFLLLGAILLRLIHLELILLLVVIPQLAAMFGQGTFNEEFTHRHFRFIYTMPVRPIEIWLVKLVSAYVTILMCAAMLTAIALVGQDESNGVLMALALLGLKGPQLGVLILVGCTFAMAAGLVCITMCQSPRVSAVLTNIIIYLVFGAAWFLMTLGREGIPAPYTLAAVLALGVAPLLVTSYIGLLQRNPFFDQPWRWRGIGAAGLALSAVLVASGAYAAGRSGDAITTPSFAALDVADMVVPPDGSFVLVTTFNTQFGTQLDLVRSADGAVVPLGEGLLAPAGFGSLRAGDPAAPLLLVAFEQRTPQWMLVDPLTGERTPLGTTEYMIHQMFNWSADGGRFTALGRRAEGEANMYLAITRADGALAVERAVPVPTGLVLGELRGEALLVEKFGDSGAVSYQAVDLATGRAAPLELPELTNAVAVLPDGQIAVLYREIDSTHVAEYLVRIDPESGTRQALASPPLLPRLPIKQAMREGGTGSVMLAAPDMPWLAYSQSDEQGFRTVLIHSESGAAIELPRDLFAHAVSPSGERVLLSHVADNDAGMAGGLRFELVEIATQQCKGLDIPPDAVLTRWLGDEDIVYRAPSTSGFGGTLHVLHLASGMHRQIYPGGAGE